ncbi:hypothetical protein G9P44_003226 [Scheffersomyces stipitis]|nr:hypothetical protein G9P44_003226 [Scheffersomyces stipitis]
MPPKNSIRLCQLLGTKEPIWQAPMAGISTARLAADVTNNGGLGALPLAMFDLRNPEGLKKLASTVDEFSRLVSSNRANTVNFNFFCHDVYSTETPPSQVKNWWTLYKNSLKTLEDSLLSKIPFDNGNVSFKEIERDYPEELTKLLDYLAEVKPKVISFHFGHPTKSTIERLQKEGIMVVVTTTSIEETKALLDLGVDGLVCQGYEAGGHRGNFLVGKELDENLSTFALFSQVQKYVASQNKDVFLIPAGGIMDASTIKYYLSLGAPAVQMGSIFLAAPETSSNGFVKKHVEGENNLTTTMIDLVSGKPARTIKTKFIDSLIKNDKFERSQLPPYGHAYNAYKVLKGLVKDHDIGFYLAGQNYHSLDPTLNTTEIIQKLSKELAQD